MTARRLLALFAVVLGLGAGISLWSTRTTGVPGGAPVEGVLAPFRPELAGPWETVARIPARSLGRGSIIDLDERGDTLYVLHVDHWVRIVGGNVSDVFGTNIRGAPNWLAAGAAIRAVPGGVLILDRVRQVVSRWSAEGMRGIEHDFRPQGGSKASIIIDGLAADTTGTVLVALRLTPLEGAGRWMVLRGRLDDTRFDTVYRSADTAQLGDVHDIPRMSPMGRGDFLLMPALGWKMMTVDTAGRTGGLRVRADGPRFAVPDSIRTGYARVVDRFPPAQRTAYALPAAFPAIRGVTTDGRGHVIVLVATGAETTQVEVLGLGGESIGRPWKEPESRATFVANGSVFRVDDDEGFTRIDRQRIRVPGER